VVNPTRGDTRQRGTRPHLGGITTDYLRSQLSCGDALGARGHSGGTGDARQTTISLDAEATDRAVSFAYVKEPAIAAQSHVDGEASRARRSRNRMEQCETGT
jgi:hypothetical protein